MHRRCALVGYPWLASWVMAGAMGGAGNRREPELIAYSAFTDIVEVKCVV